MAEPSVSLSLSVGQFATLACQLEVAAPKPGNVHRGADFEDVTLQDFMASGVAIGPVMDLAASRSLGVTVRDAVLATRQVAASNTNLGMILLLAPLAMVQDATNLRVGVQAILDQTTPEDSALVYEALRLANPGGMGTQAEMDIQAEPPEDLMVAMRHAESYDLIARQYSRGMEDLFEQVLPSLNDSRWENLPWPRRIVRAHLVTMSRFPDSLIARKCGAEIAEKSALLAAQVLEAGDPNSEAYQWQLAQLDFWLRSDGHRRNPGTTADLITAALFAGLRMGMIRPPFG
ncbi:MAG: triphosphoribosyl-dephospho-CoA synthase [Pirellulaceae bacterium]